MEGLFIYEISNAKSLYVKSSRQNSRKILKRSLGLNEKNKICIRRFDLDVKNYWLQEDGG